MASSLFMEFLQHHVSHSIYKCTYNSREINSIHTYTSKVFNTKGVKTHQPHYGIIIHRILTKAIPPLKLIDPELTLNIEFQNNIPKETITKISVL
jgi:hypothetical protein